MAEPLRVAQGDRNGNFFNRRLTFELRTSSFEPRELVVAGAYGYVAVPGDQAQGPHGGGQASRCAPRPQEPAQDGAAAVQQMVALAPHIPDLMRFHREPPGRGFTPVGAFPVGGEG